MTKPLDSDLLNYIVEHHINPGDQLPSLNDLSDELGINVGKLREQLEVARALGLVDVRTRTGIRTRPYEFLPAIRLSLLFGLARDKHLFESFTELRNKIEMSFWYDAVVLLTEDDKVELRQLVDTAKQKLSNTRFIQIPHAEHRKFHLLIFSRLENPFVQGLLEAYWDAYEAVEMNTYADLHYWQEAWNYHARIIENIDEKNFIGALEAFIEHTRLLRTRFEAALDDDALDGVNTLSPQQVKES
ncbi:MAG: FCD domain-containing protein [Anaerolineae bacterium]|nr:FadR family transcriptional regulator [Anaerolineae bacterium]